LKRSISLQEPFISCLEVLEDLMDEENAEPFNEPVDSSIPDYFTIVKNPMDLGTIRSKLKKASYDSTEKFVDDVRLVFDNCLLYNGPSTEIGIAAQTLWAYFKRQCRKCKINVCGGGKASLGNRQTEKFDNLMEHLKSLSDYEIHSFCKQRERLQSFLLSDEQIFSSSGKLVELRRELESLWKAERRVLIFSQFTQVLNILEEFLRLLGYRFLRLDGQTPVLDRQMLIDEYNRDREIFVFLLSTRAGGVSVNLTSADVCIFHDIDWNPEMDRQAEARIHRIGQTKAVTIIKLLSKNSVDEYILKLAEIKKQRNDLVIDDVKQNRLEQDDKLSIGKVLSSIFM